MLALGDIITVEIYTRRGDHREKDRSKNRTGEVIAINDKHFTIKYKNYTETFLFADIGRTYTLKQEKPKEAEIVSAVPKTLTEQAMEILPKEKLEELIKSGKTNREIAQEYGIPDHRVDVLVRKYKLVGLSGVPARTKKTPEIETGQENAGKEWDNEEQLLYLETIGQLNKIEGLAENNTLINTDATTDGAGWTEVDGVGQFVDKTQASDEEFREVFMSQAMEYPDGEMPNQAADVNKADFLKTVNLEPTSGDVPEPEPDHKQWELQRKIKDLEFEIEQVERFYQGTVRRLEAKVAELEQRFREHSHQVQYGLYSSKAVV